MSKELELPYTKEELLNLLGNIKTEEELREFIQQNSASAGGGHTDEEIRIIVAEWYQANKDTQLTKEDVDGWIAEYLEANPVSGGLTEQQVNAIVEKYIQDNNISGGVSAEEIAQAVENYIAEHPITGVTTEDIQNAVNSYLAEHPVSGIVNALSNMNIVVLGDSISDIEAGNEGHGMWIDKFKKLANPKSFTDYAVTGATWSFKSDSTEVSERSQMLSGGNNCIYNQFNRLKANVDAGSIEKPDIIFILAGSNDAFQNLSVGTPKDVFDVDTAQSTDITTLTNMSASIRFVCDTIYKTYPTTRVVLMTPVSFGGHASEFGRLITVRDTIKECADYLNVYCIDGAKSGITFHREHLDRQYLISDMAHLTKLGGDMVGKFIYDELSILPFIQAKSLYGVSDDIRVEATGIVINDVDSSLLVKGKHPVFTVSMLPDDANISKNRGDISGDITYSSSNEGIVLFPKVASLGMGYANLYRTGTATDSITGFKADKEFTIADSGT